MVNPERKRPEYPIASVDNALTLLSLFRERKQVRVADAAATLGTARSTAHRLLAMLEYHRFAQQDADTKVYSAGPALIEVAFSALEDLDIRGIARPALERLSDDLGETVHLVTLQDAAVVFLDSAETSRTLRIGSRVGRFMPAHCTAGGKAILAELPRDDLRRLYPDAGLEQMTARSSATLEELEADLDAVRRRGYATNFGESEPEVAAVAVAIPGRRAGQRAAITVSAPSTRLSEDRVPEIAEAVSRAAAALERRRA